MLRNAFRQFTVEDVLLAMLLVDGMGRRDAPADHQAIVLAGDSRHDGQPAPV